MGQEGNGQTFGAEGVMRELTMYCSARDQNIHVVLTDEPTNDAQATVFDTEVICLEIGDTCSGGACPVGAMSVDAMDARLAKSGLSPSVRRTVLAPCGGCDRTTELVVSSGGYLSCTECGTTRRWTVR